MAIAKKGLRKINVGGIIYHWRISNADDFGIYITIIRLDKVNELQNIVTAFFKHHKFFAEKPYPAHPVISPKIIRALIEMVNERKHSEEQKSINLGNCDHLIESKIGENQ